MPGEPIAELERITAQGWPGLESEWLDGWLLRAGGGWTGRANSALALGHPGDALTAQLGAITEWYAARALPPLVQVPLPTMASLADDLTVRDWPPGRGALVLVADVQQVLASLPSQGRTPPVTVTPGPDPEWLATYRRADGRAASAHVVAGVVCAGAGLRFLSVVEDGATVAVCRTSSVAAWVGVTALAVDPARRRHGLASHLLRTALRQAADDGCDQVYLQVEPTNEPALRLYRRLGFRVHHEYRYHGPR